MVRAICGVSLLERKGCKNVILVVGLYESTDHLAYSVCLYGRVLMRAMEFVVEREA